MKNSELKIIILVKQFTLNLDDILSRYPNREKVLIDKIKLLIYDILELIYESNYMPLDNNKKERINAQLKLLSKLNVLDFLMEESYKKGYITENQFKEKENILTEINKLVKGWIAYGKSNNKGNN